MFVKMLWQKINEAGDSKDIMNDTINPEMNSAGGRKTNSTPREWQIAITHQDMVPFKVGGQQNTEVIYLTDPLL